ncbi:MAG: hypothetical protein ACYC9S_03445 [Leptospirales bacterium]
MSERSRAIRPVGDRGRFSRDKWTGSRFGKRASGMSDHHLVIDEGSIESVQSSSIGKQ